ncbi:TetR/AcrR family transcriptional regulator C-terminal domain-containing protein [Mycetocola sp. JXN-3]|uniref:TetR/AcrR family transcriptional regulator C-terminal domain-containing protein n=1 Tax=Mycetocola sp. JXN-3 TaxID=2116510 RepID=UPI00165D121D|nr:TetR/AcrR family transcriptional regulator C-terminal domain-containing protein [Mycetocola sp. JXN-3]
MSKLQRNEIVDQALIILDRHGVDALTTRKIALALDVQAGALYWHFRDKRALLDALSDRIMAGVGAELAPGDAHTQLTELAHRFRAALLAHRDGARVVAGAYGGGPNTFALSGTFIDALLRAGVPERHAGTAMFTLSRFIIGHTLEEQAQHELEAAGEWEAHWDGVEDPRIRTLLAPIIDGDPADQFRLGLGILLSGLHSLGSADLADSGFDHPVDGP